MKITPEQRHNIDENFETEELLNIIDDLDEIRDIIADTEDCKPPQIRRDLLELHQLIFNMVKQGGSLTDEIYDLTGDISMTMSTIIEVAERIMDTVDQLEDLLPEREF